jgi:hypothetical protein
MGRFSFRLLEVENEPKFTPVISEFRMKIANPLGLHYKKKFIQVVWVHLDFRVLACQRFKKQAL